jgi:septal ring factor EnvC (AmiA/AmiB activator)
MATTVPDPAQQPQSAEPQKQSHPWHWIVPCLLLLCIAFGLLIWGLGLQSDLDAQKAKTEQIQKEAAATQSDVQSVSDQVVALGQSLKSAGDQLSQQTSEAQANAKAAIDDVQSKIQSLGDRAKAAKQKLTDAIKKARSGD